MGGKRGETYVLLYIESRHTGGKSASAPVGVVLLSWILISLPPYATTLAYAERPHKVTAARPRPGCDPSDPAYGDIAVLRAVKEERVKLNSDHILGNSSRFLRRGRPFPPEGSAHVCAENIPPLRKHHYRVSDLVPSLRHGNNLQCWLEKFRRMKIAFRL